MVPFLQLTEVVKISLFHPCLIVVTSLINPGINRDLENHFGITTGFRGLLPPSTHQRLLPLILAIWSRQISPGPIELIRYATLMQYSKPSQNISSFLKQTLYYLKFCGSAEASVLGRKLAKFGFRLNFRLISDHLHLLFWLIGYLGIFSWWMTRVQENKRKCERFFQDLMQDWNTSTFTYINYG